MLESARANISFDPAAAAVTRSGVTNYYWPVRKTELEDGARAIIGTYRAILNEPLRAGDPEARIAYAVTSMIFMELQAIFAARLLAAHCRRDGVEPKLPSQGAPEWHAAFFGERRELRVVAMLRRGVPRPPAWKRMTRPLADLARPAFFSRRPIEMLNIGRDTVTVSPCELTRVSARKRNLRPVYVPLYEWFYPATSQELRDTPLQPVDATLRDRLVVGLEETFVGRGASLAASPRDAIASLIDETTAWVRFYLTRIRRRPKRIPRHLWIGSSGVIWSRILAEAVHSAGGEVVGHDHAHGANYSENTLIPFNELQVKDLFVTYAPAHAELYRRVAPDLLIGPERPRVEYVSVPAAPKLISAAVSTSSPRSILFVTQYLSTGRAAAMPHMAPLTAYDWQARLISQLQTLGRTVTQKPHPQSPVPQPAVFEREFGASIAHERFEAIMDRFDLLLFDFAPQTCFGAALRSQKPIVLIDFGVTAYSPELRSLLERRCAVVPGTFDADNRAHVDPQALAAAIEAAPRLNDPAFADAIISL